MRHFKPIYVAMLLSAAASCEKEPFSPTDKAGRLETAPTVVSAPLRFSSAAELAEAIVSDGASPSTRAPGFVSFAQTEMTREGYEDDDNAVLSESFGSVLNQEGKVIFDDILVKVADEGILYGPVEQEDLIDELSRKDGLTELCEESACPYLPGSDRTYSIDGADGVYLVDTFQLLSDQESLAAGSVGQKMYEPDGPVIWGHVESLTGGSFDNDYTKPRASQKNIFECDSKICNDTKFYKQNYGVYSETGVKTKTMRKKGLIWNKFAAEVTSAVTDICIREMGNETLAKKGSGWIDVNKTYYKGQSYQIATIVVGSPNSLPVNNSQLLRDIEDAHWWFSMKGAKVPEIDGVRYVVSSSPDIALTRIKDNVVKIVEAKNTLILNLKTHQGSFYTDKGIMGQIEIRNSWYIVDMINFYGFSKYNNEKRGSILRCRRQ